MKKDNKGIGTDSRKPKHTVAVDLDGTLAEYSGFHGADEIGAPIEGAADFMTKLSEIARVVIFTGRLNPEANEGEQKAALNTVKTWLNENGIYYDEIYTAKGKPMASAFVDDRAVTCRPEEDKGAYASALKQVKGLVDGDE